MINKGALAEYSPVEMLLTALPRALSAKAVMQLELDPRDRFTFKYDTLQTHVLIDCITADALTLLDSEGAHTVLGVSLYPIPAGVPLPQMPEVVNFPAIPIEVTPVPEQAIQEIPIANVESPMDTKTDIIMKSFDASTFQMSNANKPGYGGYQTTRAWVI